jgi:hypothetical protein
MICGAILNLNSIMVGPGPGMTMLDSGGVTAGGSRHRADDAGPGFDRSDLRFAAKLFDDSAVVQPFTIPKPFDLGLIN